MSIDEAQAPSFGFVIIDDLRPDPNSRYCFAMIGPHPIAAIANSEGQDSQALLFEAAADWRGAGAGVVGLLAENNHAAGVCSAAFLRDIASGRRYSIQLDSAPAGTVCHLDAAGMGDACTDLLPQIAGADVVILSKFGKVEAMQRGLWAAFSDALAAGKPVLTTISAKHVSAWRTFAPQAQWLDPDRQSIDRWWQAVNTR